MLALIASIALAQAPCANGQCPRVAGAIRVTESYTSYQATVYAAPQAWAPTHVAASPRAGFRPVRNVGRVLFSPLRAFKGGCR